MTAAGPAGFTSPALSRETVPARPFKTRFVPRWSVVHRRDDDQREEPPESSGEPKQMTQAGVRIASGVMVAAVIVAVAAPTARAIPPFKKEFDAMYVKKDGSDTEKEFAAAADKAKCNICHKGSDKKKRNGYGDALAERLDKKADEKDKEKIQKVLKEVEELKSNPDDDSSPTFGELIKMGKLPGGEM